MEELLIKPELVDGEPMNAEFFARLDAYSKATLRARRIRDRSKYTPHQSTRECFRRQAQRAKGMI